VYLGSIDAQPKDQNLKVLAPTACSPSIVFAPGSRTGQLLFLRDQSLLARTFDLERMDVSGEALLVAEQVAVLPVAYLSYFSATAGVIVYRQAPATNAQLTWFDRSGKVLGTAGVPASFTGLTLSPNAKRLAYADEGNDGPTPRRVESK
jgi:hypothetical protein